MTFATNIESMKVRKYALVVVKPRRYLTAWTDLGAGIYSTPFAFGRVSRMWNQYNSFGELFRRTTLASVTPGDFFHDLRAGVLYVGAVSLPTNRTAEYELHISDEPWIGPADPLDAASEVVEWVPALERDPLPQNGSRDSQFGFSPLFSNALSIRNDDGWLNPHRHDSSFSMARAKGYAIATKHTDIAKAMAAGDVKATFTGFCGRGVNGLEIVTIPIVDFFQITDRVADTFLTYSNVYFSTVVQPDAAVLNAEYSVRRIRGMLDGFLPVNVDYQAIPSTTKNRNWVTHADDMGDGDLGTLTYTPVVAGSTGTKTILSTTPKVNVGDWVLINRGGTAFPRLVLTVDRAGKFVTHANIGVAQDGGRTMVRWYIARLIAEVAGVTLDLIPGVDFIPLTVLSPEVFGFALVNNFEAGYPAFGGNPMDPAATRLSCRVYGRKTPEKYTDGITDIGFAVDDGGIDASAVGILYRLLINTGLSPEDIDEASFQAIGASSHALGLAIPSAIGDQPPTYRDAITNVLQSMLWRLTFVESGNDIKIGLVEQAPMSGADQAVDEATDFRLTDFEVDYGDVYFRVASRFAIREYRISGAEDSFTLAENTLARDLHFITKKFTVDLMQYVLEDAQQVTDRLALMLGDRRAYYTLELDPRYLDKAPVGAAYDVSREQLPGFAFIPGTSRTRRMRAVEVQKSIRGVKLVFEDQKGIEDNSGGW